MTNARTIGTLALAGILSFTFIASNVMAAPQGSKGEQKCPRGERMNHCGPRDKFHADFAALSDDKKALFFSIMEEHKMSMAPVRDQLWAKRAQLKALSDDTATDMAVLTAVTDDIVALRQQMRDAAVALDARMAAEVGIDTQFALKALDGKRGARSGHGHKGHGKHAKHGKQQCPRGAQNCPPCDGQGAPAAE